MKKIYSFLVIVALFLFPFAALAAVDVTLSDDSSPESNSVSITVDTQTDVLDRLALPIQHSEGVTISSISPGDIDCSSLEFDEIADNIILVTCELSSSTALNGVLGNIEFSSQSGYFFEVLNNQDLDLGGLLLGESNRIEEIAQNEQIDQIGEPTDEFVGDDLTPGEDEFIVTTQDGLAPQAEEGFLETITEFLPYILIGGSVILLISIAAIVLGKKKGPKDPTKKSKKKKKEKVQTPPTPSTPTPAGQEASPLKSMVNSVNNGENVQGQVPPVEQPETPAPVNQHNFSSGDEKDDLQEILKRESSPQPVDSPPQAELETREPVVTESPETVMPEAPTEPIELPEQEMTPPQQPMTPPQQPMTPPQQPMTPPQQPMTPPQQPMTPPQQPMTPPQQPMTTPQQPMTPPQTTPPSQENEYPPVPPNAAHQTPPQQEKPEDLPEVPPMM